MRGHIRQRTAGSFTVYLETDKDALSGRRRQQTFTVKGSREDAEQELTRLLRERDTGGLIEESKITTGDFFRRWLADIEGTVSARTFQGYLSMMTKHLIPSLGNVPLRMLRPRHIQAFYTASLKDGGRRDNRKGGLSPQTVLHHHRLLFQVFEHAVSLEYIGRNYARAVKPPRISEKEFTVLDTPQSIALIECAEGTRLRLPIQMAIFLGLRRGEVLGAKWTDVNWDTRTVSIVRSADETTAGVGLKPPKSKRGRRTISIPGILLDALRKQRDAAKDASEFICPGADGGLWRPSAFTSAYRALIKRRGLKGPNFHLLRHGHGSQLARENMPIDDISRRLGHSRSGFTLNTYIHQVGASRDDHAADRINAIFEAEMAKPRLIQ